MELTHIRFRNLGTQSFDMRMQTIALSLKLCKGKRENELPKGFLIANFIPHH
ncbi:MAG: hypothetical protein ABI237_09785 [Ginsengibacter sp.]